MATETKTTNDDYDGFYLEVRYSGNKWAIEHESGASDAPSVKVKADSLSEGQG